jgi:hypothetical protein
MNESDAMASKEQLAELIREGLESGHGEEINDEWWRRIDAKVRQELQSKGESPSC